MRSSTPKSSRTWLLPSCLALGLAACGGPEHEPVTAPPPVTRAAPTEAASARAPRPAPTERELLVSACIEKTVHTPAYDARSPRDARHRIRWMEVKADCEQQLASR